MKILIRDFKKYEKNTLKAFADLEILDLCLVIKGCTVHQQNGKAWIGLPGKPYKDANGKDTWSNILEFSDKDKKEEFRESAVEAIKRYIDSEKEKAQFADRPTEEANGSPPF